MQAGLSGAGGSKKNPTHRTIGGMTDIGRMKVDCMPEVLAPPRVRVNLPPMRGRKYAKYTPILEPKPAGQQSETMSTSKKFVPLDQWLQNTIMDAGLDWREINFTALADLGLGPGSGRPPQRGAHLQNTTRIRWSNTTTRGGNIPPRITPTWWPHKPEYHRIGGRIAIK